MENFDFSDFLKISLFWSKKHSLPSRISKKNLFWLNLPKKYQWENIRFFHKNHGLTPLENVDFSDFLKISLFWSKKHSFPSRISKDNNFWLNLAKKIPMENLDFLDFFKTPLFSSKKHSFLPKITKHQLFLLTFCSKIPWRKHLSFWQKPWEIST